MKDWASKLPGKGDRLAGIMHCVCVGPEQCCTIEEPTMELALNVSAALIDYAIAVFDLIQLDPIIEDARRMLRWIGRQANPQFTIRDCFCAHQSRFRRVDAMMPAIHLLEQHGYIRQAPSPKTGDRPSEIYWVNPQLSK